MTIWKYVLRSERKVEMPAGAKVLHVGLQHGEVTMWCLVDPLAVQEERHFHVYGTGWNLTKQLAKERHEHIGTVIDGSLVWHVFEVKSWAG